VPLGDKTATSIQRNARTMQEKKGKKGWAHCEAKRVSRKKQKSCGCSRVEREGFTKKSSRRGNEGTRRGQRRGVVFKKKQSPSPRPGGEGGEMYLLLMVERGSKQTLIWEKFDTVPEKGKTGKKDGGREQVPRR